jgi:hypothetical protein
MTAWITLSADLARASAANAAAAVHASVTISQRLPSFGHLAFDPATAAAAAAEVEMAVTEKFAAIWLGALEAGMEWQRLGFAMAAGAVHPDALPGRLLAISEAAAGPARRAVRANARRLTR